MLAIKIWNYLKGYVIIRIEGLTLERLLNLALTNDIYLWDVKRLNNFQVEVTVSPNGLEDLNTLITKTGSKAEILDKRGFPFILHKLRKRKMFALGFIFFLFIIFTLTSFIWKIEISGTDQTPKEEIINILNENKINVGKFKRSIELEKVELLLLEEFNYFSFIEVRIKGVKLQVDVKEEPIPPEKVDKSYPANIVARKKGVIEKIIARNGVAVVKKGQIVGANQVLISGVMDSERTEDIYLVHSEGEVLARTRYEERVEDTIIKKVEKETGSVIKQKGIKVNDTGIKLIKNIPYENYKEYIFENKLFKWDFIDIDFPITLITYEYREVELAEIKQDIEHIKKANQLKGIEIINKELVDGAEIVAKEVNHIIEGNFVITTVVIETIEEIGKVQIIN